MHAPCFPCSSEKLEAVCYNWILSPRYSSHHIKRSCLNTHLPPYSCDASAGACVGCVVQEWHLKAARARVQELWGEFAAAHPDLVKGRDMSADNLMHAITLVREGGLGTVSCVCVAGCQGLGGHRAGHVC